MEVWKYHLIIGAHTFIQMPIGAQPLDVQMQGANLTMWCLVDPNAEQNTRCFAAIGTGQRINGNLCHLGTALDGSFVWHAFEVT